MIDLILFILVCYGLTNMLLYGKIFDSIRPDWYLFKCSMCMGFWAGVLVSLFFTSPWAGLIHSLFFGFISSGTTYVLDKLFGDNGMRVDHTYS